MRLYILLDAGREAVVDLQVQTGEPRVRELTGPELIEVLGALHGGVRIDGPLARVRTASSMEEEPAQPFLGPEEVAGKFEALRAVVAGEAPVPAETVAWPAEPDRGPVVHRGCPDS